MEHLICVNLKRTPPWLTVGMILMTVVALTMSPIHTSLAQVTGQDSTSSLSIERSSVPFNTAIPDRSCLTQGARQGCYLVQIQMLQGYEITYGRDAPVDGTGEQYHIEQRNDIYSVTVPVGGVTVRVRSTDTGEIVLTHMFPSRNPGQVAYYRLRHVGQAAQEVTRPQGIMLGGGEARMDTAATPSQEQMPEEADSDTLEQEMGTGTVGYRSFGYNYQFILVTAVSDFTHGAGVNIIWGSVKGIGFYLKGISQKIYNPTISYPFNSNLGGGLNYTLGMERGSVPYFISFYSGVSFSRRTFREEYENNWGQFRFRDAIKQTLGVNVGLIGHLNNVRESRLGFNLLIGASVTRKDIFGELGAGITVNL